MIAIGLSKQVLDADPRAIQQINFIANLNRAGYITMFFITKEAKETILDFSPGTVKVLWVQLNAIPLNAISLSDFFINIKWRNTTV